MTGPSAADWNGRIIDGRYVVEAFLGRGGMGVVLAARHKFTGARVAVKMVRGDLGLDAEIEARFLAEARVPTAIDHRGVVKTLDAGKTAAGELYLVMELLQGRSLRAQITSGLGGPSIRRIGMELLDVVAAAHARRIIHRDVKPENVFLVEPELTVKLLDFGITKVLAGTASALPRTAAGVMLGTLAYMAPEQLADASSVDARADLWSVGVILYEMLSGRRPHLATTVEEMFVALVKGAPDPIRVALPSAAPDVEAFFARALARDPQHRFASAAEMAMAFARLPLVAPVAPVAPAARPAGGDITMASGFAPPPGGNATMASGFARPLTGGGPPSPGRAQPPGGNVTMASGFAPPPGNATGFANTLATPEQGIPSVAAPAPRPRMAPDAPTPDTAGPVAVLTPFAATPALVGAVPTRAEGHGSAPIAALATPGRGAPARPPTPGFGSPMPQVATATAVTSTAARRRFAVMAGGLVAVALAAAIVVATRGGTPPAARAPSPGSAVAVASPAPPAPTAPAPAATSATPASPATPASLATPAIPTTPASLATPASPATPTPRTPAARPTTTTADPARASRPEAPSSKRIEVTAPAAHAAVRAGGAQPQSGPLDPYAPPGPSTPTRVAGVTLQPPEIGKALPLPAPAVLHDPAACAAGCKLLASCHLGSRTCEADCAQPGALGTCLQQAAGDCNRFASCWFASSCHGATPGGQHTCSAAMDCEAACNADTSCVCDCVHGLSSHHAATLLGYNGCALACRDADCIATRCGAQARLCRAE